MRVSTRNLGLLLVGGERQDNAGRRARKAPKTAARSTDGRSPVARMEAVELTFLSFCDRDPAGARRITADVLAEVQPLAGEGLGLAEEVFVARCLVALVCEGHVRHPDLGALTAALQDGHQANLLAVGIRALGDPQLLLLPLEESLDAVLALLETLGPLHAPSVWVPRTPSDTRLLRWRSEVPSADVPALVSRVLAGESKADAGTWTAVPIRNFERACAVLVFRADADDLARTSCLVAPLERILSRAFERAALSVTNADRSAALVRASERRLSRVGFDLHDGPLQDVALMTGELAAIRAALARHTGADPALGEILHRVDDLAALISCTDTNLREVANSLDSIGELRRPFRETVNAILRTFTTRTGIEPTVELAGDIDGLSDSQRITLLRVVQESLTNVRDHSQATNVRVAITAGATRVDAIIEDDGKGFEVEPALRDAARRGRMGLLGIVERVRLLGGFCDIVSQPGEGACVSLTVARWTPEMAALATKAPAASGSA